MRPKQRYVELSGKTRAWKSEVNPVIDSSPRYGLINNFDGNCKSLSVASDGIKKSPVLVKGNRDGIGNRRDLVQLRKVKSDVTCRRKCEGESSLKVKSGSNKIRNEPVRSSNRSISLQKVKTEVGRKTEKLDGDGSIRGEELGQYGEKEITSNLGSVGQVKVQCEIEEKSVDLETICVEKEKLEEFTEDKKLLHVIAKPIQFSPFVDHAKVHSVTYLEIVHATPSTNSKLQGFVDLIMWKDVSKSTLVFGVGTFFIISSSYTNDHNISFISVVSYFGLVYLASVFFFRSFINRDSIDVEIRQHDDYVVGEEEAIWVVNLILPYINEFLLKFRALFSGDPATTMKLAVLLFVLARTGSSITIGKMIKLGFFGVFILPKVCYSYSWELTAVGTFWIRRFRDTWDSCSHKKAVGFGMFILVWNLCSPVARIWAVFMLLVAFKYYQHSLI